MVNLMYKDNYYVSVRRLSVPFGTLEMILRRLQNHPPSVPTLSKDSYSVCKFSEAFVTLPSMSERSRLAVCIRSRCFDLAMS